MKMTKLRYGLLAMTAFTVALPQFATAQLVAAKTTVITACGKLFSIDSNADKKTPEQRAAIVQRNLDNALVAAKHRTPDAVRVVMMNNNPVVTLDNFYIVTADSNSAARNHMTQMELAQKWADSIRFCLADARGLANYIAMLTGKYSETTRVKATTQAAKADVAVMPWGQNLPIQLATSLDAVAAHLGEPVQGVLSTDVPLGPNFRSYLPKGTLALGEVLDASPFNPNHYAGKDALTISFYALKTPDGKEIPINGHILGDLNTWRYVSVNPVVPACAAEGKLLISGDTIAFSSCAGYSGVIGGAWRGMSEDQQTHRGFHRLLLSRDNGVIIPAGEPMMLQLNATSSVAVVPMVPVTQLSSVDHVM